MSGVVRRGGARRDLVALVLLDQHPDLRVVRVQRVGHLRRDGGPEGRAALDVREHDGDRLGAVLRRGGVVPLAPLGPEVEAHGSGDQDHRDHDDDGHDDGGGLAGLGLWCGGHWVVGADEGTHAQGRRTTAAAAESLPEAAALHCTVLPGASPRQGWIRREEGGEEGGGNPKLCVPKMAPINVSFSKFSFTPPKGVPEHRRGGGRGSKSKKRNWGIIFGPKMMVLQGVGHQNPYLGVYDACACA